MKKSSFILAMLFFVVGCDAKETPTTNDVANKIVTEATETEKERTESMEIHVYSDEVPWGIPAASSSYTSINAALAEAIEGDVIVVHEGIYREMINVTKDNVTIVAPEGEYVLVTGNEVVTGFEAVADMPGVYVADVPTQYTEGAMPFSQVFANGAYQNIARFPNYEIDDMMAPLRDGSGYGDLVDIYKPANTKEGFATFVETIPDVDLTGAVYRGVHGKNREYVYGNIVSKEANTIKFKGYSKNSWTSNAAIAKGYHDFGFGFILDKNLIDLPGEWFVENRKLYYMPDGNIEDLEMEMQVRKQVLTISNAENVTIENINFVAGNAHLKNVDNVAVENCTFRYLQPFFMTTTYGIGASAQTGIYMFDANNTTFKDTYVAHSWGTGFNIEGGDGNQFLNCIVEDIGWNGTFTAGVYINGDNTYIKDCTFRDNGRFQIRVNAQVKFDIIHSLFERAMKMGEDAGVISMADAGGPGANDLKGTEMAYNIIRDFNPLPISSRNYAAPFILAFYMENSDNYTIHHNLIYDLTDEDFIENYSDVDLLHKTASLLYFGPGSRDMDDPVRFYNNTAWNYLNNFQIWNIAPVDLEELKANNFQTDAGGSMTQGHFANNLLNTGNFSLNNTTQSLSPEGKNLGTVNVPERTAMNIATNDMDEFIAHVATLGYHFNPEANLVLDPATGAANYVNASEGDFHLAADSPAKGAGVPIEGITSSATPDLGALEGGDYVLSAGSTLKIRDFKEIR